MGVIKKSLPPSKAKTVFKESSREESERQEF